MLKLKTFISTVLHKKMLLSLSILLGINLAFYFSAYLKTDFIPLGSTRFLAFTGLLSAVASLAYFMLSLWAERQLSALSSKTLLNTILLSLGLGSLLFFTTTSQWLEPEFYIRSTLPISYELFVPWYASRGMAFVVGTLFFATLVFALLALLLPKKKEVHARLEAVIAPLTFDEGKNKEGRIIFALLVFAFILRVINIDLFPPHLEEFNHLNAAKELLSGVPKALVYQRSYYMVTLPVKFFFSLFGMSVSSARLPGALLNSLAVIPLFLMTRKLNKSIAILSALLYATSPWVINLSRIVREYAYYPFFFYGTLYILLYLLENFPEKFVISEWRLLFRSRVLISVFILSLPVIYALGIDPGSTAKVIGLAYIVFLLFIFPRFDIKNKNNILFFALLLIALGIFRLITLSHPVLAFHDHLAVADSLRSIRNGNAVFLLGQFFFNPPLQWYYDRTLFFSIISIFFSFLWAFSIRRKNIIPLFLAVLYSLSLLAFLLFYDFTYASRFFLHIELWYIPLLAIGMYGWYSLADLWLKKKGFKIALFALIMLVSFNFRQSFVHAIAGEASVTSSIHVNFDKIDNLIAKTVKPEDILISKYYGRYVKFYDFPVFAGVYEESYDVDLIEAHDSGWIVVDELRYWAYDKVLLRENIYINDIEIEYMGEFPDPTSGLSNFVWHWDKMP